MKKLALVLAIVMLFTFTATGCGKIRGVEIDYGTSEKYTIDDLQDAISPIFEKFFFANHEAKLNSLSYSGDKISDESKKYYEKLYDEEFEQCMEFNGNVDYESLNIQTNEYEIQNDPEARFITAKHKDGTWEILSCSYYGNMGH